MWRMRRRELTAFEHFRSQLLRGHRARYVDQLDRLKHAAESKDTGDKMD